MTLRKFAALIGYSPSTVSKAFGDAADVNEQTRKTILSLAKKYGVYDLFRKEKYDKKMIAVLIPEASSEYYTQYISALNELIAGKNASMTVSLTSFRKDTETDLIRYYSSQDRADGIIIIDGVSAAEKYARVPVVYAGNKEDPYADSVNVDFSSGISETVFTFKTLGHRIIAFIGDNLTQGKEMLFRQSMKLHDMDIDEKLIVKSDLRFEKGGYDCMNILLKEKERPTAVLTAYDYLAFGAIRRAEEEGLSVPNDVSVVGMDNTDIAAHDKIGLSSIDSHHEEVCDLLVSRLFEKIQKKDTEIIYKTEIKSSLINRKSVTVSRSRTD